MNPDKPQSTEACLVRLFDKVQFMSDSVTSVGCKIDNIEKRVLSIECKMTHLEGEKCGATQVKKSVTPYILAVISVLLTAIASMLLYYTGFK
jgi:hypothetical protein